MALRFHVQPGDVPAPVAARRLGLTEAEFEALLPRLLSRGFPACDPDTLKYDLEAIDEWRRRRHRHLFAEGLTKPEPPNDARSRIEQRLAEARQQVG